MIRRIVAVICLAAWCIGNVSAQSEQAGTRAFPFLNLDYDARTMSMGGVAVAVPNDLYGVAYNPAAAGYISKRQVLIGYRSVIDDVWGAPIAVALPYSNWGTFALSIIDVSYGSLMEIDEGATGGIPTDIRWHWFSFAGSLSWAKVVWESLSIGGSLREIHDYVGSTGGTGEHYSADAIVLQGGLQYRWFGSRVIAGLAINNLGIMIKSYSDQTEDLKMPVSVAAGVSYSPQYIPNLRLALDLAQPADGALTYKLGGEVDIYKRYALVRIGYSFTEPDLESQLRFLQGGTSNGYQKMNWAGLCFGAGFNADIGMVHTGLDVGVQLIQDMEPALAVSVMAGF
jgi:hypothetical protein